MQSDTITGPLKKTLLQQVHSTCQFRLVCEKMMTLQQLMSFKQQTDGRNQPDNTKMKTKKSRANKIVSVWFTMRCTLSLGFGVKATPNKMKLADNL